ncbi:hypothetical protein ACWX0K_11930 [Nitrobacteraceae bacterium UC4446_H13]
MPIEAREVFDRDDRSDRTRWFDRRYLFRRKLHINETCEIHTRETNRTGHQYRLRKFLQAQTRHAFIVSQIGIEFSDLLKEIDDPRCVPFQELGIACCLPGIRSKIASVYGCDWKATSTFVAFTDSQLPLFQEPTSTWCRW